MKSLLMLTMAIHGDNLDESERRDLIEQVAGRFLAMQMEIFLGRHNGDETEASKEWNTIIKNN